MSNYISSEVKKIIESKELSYPKNFAMASAWILANYKGINLKVLNMTNHGAIADFFVMVSANNRTQAQSMAEELIHQFKEFGQNPISVEGMQEAEWILIDMGDFLIHIFQELSRDLFDLDRLWIDAPQEKIPQEYYFGPNQGANNSEDSENDYF